MCVRGGGIFPLRLAPVVITAVAARECARLSSDLGCAKGVVLLHTEGLNSSHPIPHDAFGRVHVPVRVMRGATISIVPHGHLVDYPYPKSSMCVRSPLPRVLDHGYVSVAMCIGLPEGTIFHPQSQDWVSGGNRSRSRCPYYTNWRIVA